MLEALRRQYEKHPYPPIPFLALPRRGEGRELRYPGEISGRRILIAGCGTLEPAVVAQMHSDAQEIVAVDLSGKSLQIARRRMKWLRVARPLRSLPPVRFVQADAGVIGEGDFDYVIASNVLHHSADPARLLAHLSELLRADGLMRVVTYPKGSRYWMRRTSEWLSGQDLSAETPDLVARAHQAIRTLSPSNPVRSSFDGQPETRTRAGLVDAFFNACERPLGPLEWETASRAAGLTLVSEAQAETSRSDFLDGFLADPGALSVWEKLQILDDTWELCANPVLWFRKTGEVSSVFLEPSEQSLREQLLRAETLLAKGGRSLADFQAWLRRKVGPRVNPKHPDELLRGLSLTEYDLHELLRT